MNDTADNTIDEQLPDLITPGDRLLTAAEFHRLADVPPEVEWFANLSNPSTRRAYENAVRDFMRFTGIKRPEEFRTVTLVDVAWLRDRRPCAPCDGGNQRARPPGRHRQGAGMAGPCQHRHHTHLRPPMDAPRGQPHVQGVVLSADMSDLDSPVSPMRFTKAEVLDIFRRQDATYRLAILASHWLRGATNYKPSAAEEARSLAMEAAGKRIPFSDLADELERDPGPIASEFVLNQLHASVRVPLEILTAYCLDHDRRTGHSALVPRLRATAWYLYRACHPQRRLARFPF